MSSINVRIRFQNAINWQNETECDFHINDQQIDIWRIDISANLILLDYFFKLLNPEEIIRAHSYVRKKDSDRFIISRAALRFILGKYTQQPASGIKFILGNNKKPSIWQHSLKYNISHSGNWILIAVSNTEIGTDTEEINSELPYKDILPGNFNTDEISYILTENAMNAFYLLWTRKEALTKATGQGLDENLKYIPCLTGTHEIKNTLLKTSKNWYVNSFETADQNIGSFATDIPEADVKYWNINFKKLLTSL
jgi:4'-phosphopantetheinyl transferase